MLALVVLEQDAAHDAVAADDLKAKRRLALVGARQDVEARRLVLGGRADDPRRAALEGAFEQRPRRNREAHAVFELVKEVDFPRLVVEPADADVVALQHFAQLVADQVDDPLEVERAGHALLDAVDHRELGVALLGFLQETLRLVEQARVLQRHAHRGRNRLEQAHFGVAERVLALVVFELEASKHAIAGDDLHVDV